MKYVDPYLIPGDRVWIGFKDEYGDVIGYSPARYVRALSRNFAEVRQPLPIGLTVVRRSEIMPIAWLYSPTQQWPEGF